MLVSVDVVFVAESITLLTMLTPGTVAGHSHFFFVCTFLDHGLHLAMAEQCIQFCGRNAHHSRPNPTKLGRWHGQNGKMAVNLKIRIYTISTTNIMIRAPASHD